MALSNPQLAELADVVGIATQFWDWKGRLSEASDETVIAILAGMDIDASTPEKAQEALNALSERPWRRVLPPCVVVEAGQHEIVHAHVPEQEWVRMAVRLEDGEWRDLSEIQDDQPRRTLDEVQLVRHSFELPGDLPLGYHRLQATTTSGQTESTLVVSPGFLGFPARMQDKRIWGYSTQLYSLTSDDSWGIGDLLDLADLAIWSGTQQYAGFVLVNPLHAAEPVPPIEPSPYLPRSRRYVNPIYLRPEAIAEYAELEDKARARIEELKLELAAALAGEELVVRDLVWGVKLEALRIIHGHGLRAARRMAFEEFLRHEGRGLTQFATWSALVATHGADWREWPAELQRPSSPKVADFAEAHREEIDFQCWLQWIADTQLQATQAAAVDAGMRVGIVNDLAVGVGADSAEAWTYATTFAEGISVGAPPDHFNQTGQDWGQTPWRPDRLDELSYAPFRTMIAGVLRHCGGIRIDHIMGMFRLWWIPEGRAAAQGAYVRYNHRAMVGILVLEAHRAGALVVGEDLGVVEPWVRDYLRQRGILGTSVFWFERDHEGRPLPPESWREYCLASVTTHDLPPTAGYLAGDHIRLQHRLGLLTESLDSELATAEVERAMFVEALRNRGLLTLDEPDTVEIIEAMHRYLSATPSRLLCVALADAVGERRTQNQPGTIDQYPNWRVPLGGPDGKRLSLEQLYRDERSFRLAGIMNGFSGPMTSGALADGHPE